MSSFFTIKEEVTSVSLASDTCTGTSIQTPKAPLEMRFCKKSDDLSVTLHGRHEQLIKQ